MSQVVVCRTSGEAFTVDEDDSVFYERVSPKFGAETCALPAPTLHPKLRAMRRMAWRNSNHLYRRKCDKSSAAIISAYPQDAPYPVFATNVWWGDDWQPLASGADFDFNRPFFEQFQELQRRAPRPALMNRDSENSDYCNYAGENKHCYMANNGSWYNDGCLFGEAYLRSRDSVDCNYLRGSELCYEVVGGDGLYECAFVNESYHCTSCFFSFNLRSCTDCFLCSNLRNAQGFILNRPASKGEMSAYREKMKTQAGLQELREQFEALQRESLHPDVLQINCEQSTGELLTNCKNVQLSFVIGSIRDGKYLFHCDEGQDMWDCSLSGYGGSELYYETVSSGCGGVRSLFSSGSWSSNDVLYCDTVMSCNSCFGCVGLKRAEYCVLNRAYSRAEYERLVPKIIAHMRETKEWGEFFPEQLAPHAYNESSAHDFYPLTDQEALGLGYRWKAEAAPEHGSAAQFSPESIDDCSPQICGTTFTCEQSGKSFRIVPQELAFLKRVGIAPPRLAPEPRRRGRTDRRNPPRLWERTCCIDHAPILTTFALDRPEKVCCQKCYLESLYGKE